MKYILTILLLIGAVSANGQTTKQVDSLNFVSKEFNVPKGCKAPSAYQVQCHDFTMVWFYTTEEMLKMAPEQAVIHLSEQLKDFKKTSIPVYLLGEEVKGYILSFNNEATKKSGYQIVAYGIAAGQPVLVQLALDKEPKTDADLPDFPKQIIRLKK